MKKKDVGLPQSRACLDFFLWGAQFSFVYYLLLKYAFFSRKIYVQNAFINKKLKKSSNRKIFYLNLVLNLDKLKQKEPEKSYELTNCISKYKSAI